MKNLLIRCMLVVVFVALLPLAFVRVMVAAPAPTNNSRVAAPAFVDGFDKKVKKRSAHKRKAKPTALASLQRSTPFVDIYWSFDNPKMVINIRFQSLFTQPMKQVGDAINPLLQNGLVAPGFDSPRDREIAEAIVKEFKPAETIFYPATKSPQRASISTIAMTREDTVWTNTDVQAIRILLEKLFAPMKVGFSSDPFNPAQTIAGK